MKYNVFQKIHSWNSWKFDTKLGTQNAVSCLAFSNAKFSE